eukprot:403373652
MKSQPQNINEILNENQLLKKQIDMMAEMIEQQKLFFMSNNSSNMEDHNLIRGGQGAFSSGINSPANQELNLQVLSIRSNQQYNSNFNSNYNSNQQQSNQQFYPTVNTNQNSNLLVKSPQSIQQTPSTHQSKPHSLSKYISLNNQKHGNNHIQVNSLQKYNQNRPNQKIQQQQTISSHQSSSIFSEVDCNKQMLNAVDVKNSDYLKNAASFKNLEINKSKDIENFQGSQGKSGGNQVKFSSLQRPIKKQLGQQILDMRVNKMHERKSSIQQLKQIDCQEQFYSNDIMNPEISNKDSHLKNFLGPKSQKLSLFDDSNDYDENQNDFYSSLNKQCGYEQTMNQVTGSLGQTPQQTLTKISNNISFMKQNPISNSSSNRAVTRHQRFSSIDNYLDHKIQINKKQNNNQVDLNMPFKLPNVPVIKDYEDFIRLRQNADSANTTQSRFMIDISPSRAPIGDNQVIDYCDAGISSQFKPSRNNPIDLSASYVSSVNSIISEDDPTYLSQTNHQNIGLMSNQKMLQKDEPSEFKSPFQKFNKNIQNLLVDHPYKQQFEYHGNNIYQDSTQNLAASQLSIILDLDQPLIETNRFSMNQNEQINNYKSVQLSPIRARNFIEQKNVQFNEKIAGKIDHSLQYNNQHLLKLSPIKNTKVSYANQIQSSQLTSRQSLVLDERQEENQHVNFMIALKSVSAQKQNYLIKSDRSSQQSLNLNDTTILKEQTIRIDEIEKQSDFANRKVLVSYSPSNKQRVDSEGSSPLRYLSPTQKEYALRLLQNRRQSISPSLNYQNSKMHQRQHSEGYKDQPCKWIDQEEKIRNLVNINKELIGKQLDNHMESIEREYLVENEMIPSQKVTHTNRIQKIEPQFEEEYIDGGLEMSIRSSIMNFQNAPNNDSKSQGLHISNKKVARQRMEKLHQSPYQLVDQDITDLDNFKFANQTAILAENKSHQLIQHNVMFKIENLDNSTLQEPVELNFDQQNEFQTLAQSKSQANIIDSRSFISNSALSESKKSQGLLNSNSKNRFAKLAEGIKQQRQILSDTSLIQMEEETKVMQTFIHETIKNEINIQDDFEEEAKQEEQHQAIQVYNIYREILTTPSPRVLDIDLVGNQVQPDSVNDKLINHENHASLLQEQQQIYQNNFQDTFQNYNDFFFDNQNFLNDNQLTFRPETNQNEEVQSTINLQRDACHTQSIKNMQTETQQTDMLSWRSSQERIVSALNPGKVQANINQYSAYSPQQEYLGLLDIVSNQRSQLKEFDFQNQYESEVRYASKTDDGDFNEAQETDSQFKSKIQDSSQQEEQQEMEQKLQTMIQENRYKRVTSQQRFGKNASSISERPSQEDQDSLYHKEENLQQEGLNSRNDTQQSAISLTNIIMQESQIFSTNQKTEETGPQQLNNNHYQSEDEIDMPLQMNQIPIPQQQSESSWKYKKISFQSSDHSKYTPLKTQEEPLSNINLELYEQDYLKDANIQLEVNSFNILKTPSSLQSSQKTSHQSSRSQSTNDPFKSKEQEVKERKQSIEKLKVQRLQSKLERKLQKIDDLQNHLKFDFEFLDVLSKPRINRSKVRISSKQQVEVLDQRIDNNVNLQTPNKSAKKPPRSSAQKQDKETESQTGSFVMRQKLDLSQIKRLSQMNSTRKANTPRKEIQVYKSETQPSTQLNTQRSQSKIQAINSARYIIKGVCDQIMQDKVQKELEMRNIDDQIKAITPALIPKIYKRKQDVRSRQAPDISSTQQNSNQNNSLKQNQVTDQLISLKSYRAPIKINQNEIFKTQTSASTQHQQSSFKITLFKTEIIEGTPSNTSIGSRKSSQLNKSLLNKSDLQDSNQGINQSFAKYIQKTDSKRTSSVSRKNKTPNKSFEIQKKSLNSSSHTPSSHSSQLNSQKNSRLQTPRKSFIQVQSSANQSGYTGNINSQRQPILSQYSNRMIVQSQKISNNKVSQSHQTSTSKIMKSPFVLESQEVERILDNSESNQTLMTQRQKDFFLKVADDQKKKIQLKVRQLN